MVVLPLLAVFSLLFLLDSVLGECSVDTLSRELRRVLSKSRLLAAKLDLTARDLSNQTESFQQDLQVSLRQAVEASFRSVVAPSCNSDTASDLYEAGFELDPVLSSSTEGFDESSGTVKALARSYNISTQLNSSADLSVLGGVSTNSLCFNFSTLHLGLTLGVVCLLFTLLLGVTFRGGYYWGFARRVSRQQASEGRVAQETITALLTAVESLLLVFSTKAFLSSPLKIPNLDEIVAVLADPAPSAHRRSALVKYASLLQGVALRLKQMEAGIADFQLSKTSLHMFLASLEAAKDLQYYPVKSVTTHASRVVRLLEGMEASMTSADFFELRTRLEYVTAAKANPFAEMDIADSCPHAAQDIKETLF